MKTRAPAAAGNTLPVPRIFVSASTGDLGSVRRAVANALRGINALAVEQEHFAPPGQTVTGMIKSLIRGCHAVIHIAGLRSGSGETAGSGATYAEGQRSFTQFEYDTALSAGCRLYVFVCAESFPYDPCEPEPEDRTLLQREHRARLLTSPHFYHQTGTLTELLGHVGKLDDQVRLLAEELVRTRRNNQRFLAASLAAAALLGTGLWLVQRRTGGLDDKVS